MKTILFVDFVTYNENNLEKYEKSYSISIVAYSYIPGRVFVYWNHVKGHSYKLKNVQKNIQLDKCKYFL